MEINQFNKRIELIGVVNTIIEIVIGGVAYFLVPRAALVGSIVGLGSVIALWIAACLFPNHFFLRKTRRGSASEAFWNGLIWDSYYLSLRSRGSPIKSIFSDNWSLVALLCLALNNLGPVISCSLLGAAFAVSLVGLWQYVAQTSKNPN